MPRRLRLESPSEPRDIPMVMGAIMFLCVVFSLVNLCVDLLYAFVDPQIKAQYKGK